MKLTAAATIAALTLASSQSLAAPMPRDAPETSQVEGVSAEAGEGEGGLKKKRSDASLAESSQPELRKKSSMIRDESDLNPRRVSGSDQIRRGLPLGTWASDTSHLRQRRATPEPNEFSMAAPQPGLVGTLGLDGALGALGLGGLMGQLEGVVGGLPVAGPLVAPLLGTVDDTVGVTALLTPKGQLPKGPAPAPGAAPAARDKRQLGALNGAAGTIPLSTLLGALGQIQGTAGGLLGTATGTLGGVAGGTPLGGVVGTVGGIAGGAVGTAGALAGGVTNSVAGTAGGALNAATGAAGSTVSQGTPSILGGMSIAQAEALGILPAGFANSLLVQIAKTPVSAATASQLIAQANQLNANAATAAGGAAPAPVKAAAPAGVLNYLMAGGAPAASASEIASSAVGSGAAAAPTFAIAPAAAVHSAMTNVNKASAATAAPAPKSTTSSAATDGESSASEYSDSDLDGEDSSDEEVLTPTSATATTTVTGTSTAAGHGHTLMVEKPTYNAISARAMADSPSQQRATNEAMRIQASEQGETAVPANVEGGDMLRIRSLD